MEYKIGLDVRSSFLLVQLPVPGPLQSFPGRWRRGVSFWNRNQTQMTVFNRTEQQGLAVMVNNNNNNNIIIISCF